MKKTILIFCLALSLSTIALQSYAFEFEIAGGAWYQKPSGDLSFDKSTTDDDLDLEDDLGFDDKLRAFGRLILYLPGFFPNVYLMYTPMKWDDEGSKNNDFKFGDDIFEADIPIDSELEFNHFDIGLFYGLPFFKKATSDILNIDLGVNFRLLDVRAEIEQKDLDLKESESYFLPLPMIYTGLQIEPLKYLGFEFEGRGIGWSGNYHVSLTGRLKLKPYGPTFVAGGYRYDNVKIDYQDLDLDATFQGPFAEAGLEF